MRSLCARHATKNIKSAMTVLELMLVIALVMGIGSLGLLTSARFWRAYQLDQASMALEHFLEQAEIIGTLTQADLMLEFVSTSGHLQVQLKGCLPLPISKLACKLDLPGIDQIDLRLKSKSLVNQRLVWRYASPVQGLEIKIMSSAGQRSFTSHSSWQAIEHRSEVYELGYFLLEYEKDNRLLAKGEV